MVCAAQLSAQRSFEDQRNQSLFDSTKTREEYVKQSSEEEKTHTKQKTENGVETGG